MISQLKAGQLGMPGTLASWRAAAPEDKSALNQLRASCPWKTHEANLDLRVATLLLADKGLYQRLCSFPRLCWPNGDNNLANWRTGT